ncbi:RhoGAP-domain-containing protein [Hesseltinella vesiculosa]|uniref:RhoGAP-domain-containing protein n=1 Tax=Hesseltinella vesiculosa TaxID=101127 RepID=A0A1X2GJ75_9FUNG|nr:RhoGAP-domain-containing protein [Hesseltinella vesiculosa]
MTGTASCCGCSLPIEDGSVIAFGESLFHLNCFVCTKCKQSVDCDANLLLLSDGRPVCENCSYICKACQVAIYDEAIMTGDEVYHADCFCCTACHKKIEDLIFTQTSKGIYCTPCYEQRRAEKTKRREQRRLQQRKQSLDSTSHEPSPSPTPSGARSSSNEDLVKPEPTPLAAKPSNSRYRLSKMDFPDLASSLSFFDNDSVDLLNLSNSLGANLSLDKLASAPSSPLPSLPEDPAAVAASQHLSVYLEDSSLNRASDMLRYSLGFLDFPSPPTDSDDQNDDQKSHQQLKNELKDTKLQLIEMEKNLNKVKDASRQALDEFTKAKEQFVKESTARQQQENLIQQMRHQLVLLQQAFMRQGRSLDVTDLAQKAQLRADFDRYCRDLQVYRQRVAKEIDDFIQQKQAGLPIDPTSHLRDQQGSILVEIQMLKKERDALAVETTGLTKARDDVIMEMVLLNTKISELTEMNNDLSRRVTERERETAAVLAGTSFVAANGSGSGDSRASADNPEFGDVAVTKRVASRDSYNGILAPKLFKIKKVNNMFSKLNTSSLNPNRKDPSNTLAMSPGTMTSPTANLLYSDSYMNASTVSFANKQSQDGSHAFLPVPLTSKSSKCDGCHERIKKGSTELKCQSCGITSHTRCLGRIAAGCQGTDAIKSKTLGQTKKKKKCMFGYDLTAQCQQEQIPVPHVVTTCIDAVEHRGLDYEGIYRKSGGAAQMRLIQLGFDRGDINLNDEDTFHDIGAITSVLKSYLRELPDPLLTYEFYYQWMEVISLPEGANKLETVCELLLRLPKAHYDTLAALMFHLDRVQLHHDENRMTTKNLALVFGPTLIRSKDPSRELLDMGVKNSVVEYLISHVYDLF